jgi:hypothetical protein
MKFIINSFVKCDIPDTLDNDEVSEISDINDNINNTDEEVCDDDEINDDVNVCE